MSIFSRKPSGSEPDGERSADGLMTHRREVQGTALVLLLVFLGFVGWLGFKTLDAKSNLEQSRKSAQQVKEALLNGDSAEAIRHAGTALADAQAAQAATHSIPWNMVAAVPFLGDPFKTGQQISDVVVGLAADILQPTAEAGVGLSPEALYSNGRVDVELLRKQKPMLSELAADATRLNDQAMAIAAPGFLSAVGNARSQLQDQTNEVAALLRNTYLASQIGPSMMGADGPRTYLMAFQTNAEARGTGGLLGGFGILRFDKGKPTVDTLAPNTELAGATATVDLGTEFNDLYGWANAFTDFRNSNLSSHFPYAAQIWRSMWERDSGVKVDGVIALDPVALSYILGAVGPVNAPDGEVVTQDNVIELTESTAYVRFPTDQPARKKYLQDIANAVVQKVTGSVKSPGKLLEALGKAASERRIMVWSAEPAEQEILEQSPLGHAIPNDPAPYAEVIINNLAGNKMDYYLKREIEFAADSCVGDMRNSTIAVRLTNTAGDGNWPDYVAGTMGLNPNIPIKVPPGTMVTSVKLLATKGAQLTTVTSNGERITAVTSVERGHPSFEVQVAIPPGQSGELSFQLSEPTASGTPRVPIQPLIDGVKPGVSVPTCQ